MLHHLAAYCDPRFVPSFPLSGSSFHMLAMCLCRYLGNLLFSSHTVRQWADGYEHGGREMIMNWNFGLATNHGCKVHRCLLVFLVATGSPCEFSNLLL
jgi:hypothetical protein